MLPHPLMLALKRAAGSKSRQTQLFARLRNAILRGVIPPGARFPSSRDLAEHLGLSRGTVIAAYARLEIEGLTSAQGAAGTYVSDRIHTSPSKPVRHNTSSPPSRRELLPCTPGVPALEHIPQATWARLITRVSRRATTRSLASIDAAGHVSLRKAIAEHVAVARGVDCHPARVFITTGYQGALGLVSRALLLPRDLVWCEDPGYPPTRWALEAAAHRPVGISVDHLGMNIDEAIKKAPRARLAIVTAAHQMPLGCTLSIDRRHQLLEWTYSHHSWVLEDEYDAEFHYGEYPLPSLTSLDRDQRVLLTGTFSKTLFPAIRLGYVIVPSEQVERFEHICSLLQPTSGPQAQEALAELISQGHYARHLRNMRRLYAKRRDALVEALRQRGASWQIHTGAGGLHLHIELDQGLDDKLIAQHCREQGLGPLPMSYYRFSNSHSHKPGLVLSFANLSERNAERVVSTLYQCVERHRSG